MFLSKLDEYQPRHLNNEIYILDTLQLIVRLYVNDFNTGDLSDTLMLRRIDDKYKLFNTTQNDIYIVKRIKKSEDIMSNSQPSMFGGN